MTAGGASSSGSGTATATTTWFNPAQLKATLKKYGKTGFVTYLGLSTCVTAGFYVAIENAVDVKSILGIKKSEDDSDREPSFLERVVLGKGSNLALAMICSKMLVPVKIPVAVALTPYVQRFLNRFKVTVPKNQ